MNNFVSNASILGCFLHGTVPDLILIYHISIAILNLRIKEVCASGNVRDEVFFS